MAIAVTTASAQTELTDADLNGAYATTTYNNRISIHDPSAVYDNISRPSSPVVYIYGSHLGHGNSFPSTAYKTWSGDWAAGETAGTSNSLFANSRGTRINYANAYPEAHAWQFKGDNVQGNQWAPDIIYNKRMKKWCLYMSLNSNHWCSSIVMFTSDHVVGPWVNKGAVVYSGFQGSYAHNGYDAAGDWQHTDVAQALGDSVLPQRYKVGSQWGSYWPNCIDPCVFYDDNDSLWMSYGSWSGGIFMLKLDSETGLRDYAYTYPYEVNGRTATPGAANSNCTSDPYFGKKIAGGYYVSGEGSYIQKIGSHWFLFLSYGGLNPSAGYQMRVFRSDSPTGPYVDAYGTSAIYNAYRLNYGSRATDNRGVLLMDGYKWDTMPTGEVAQGHNSAFTDNQGRTFVVYHTKFNDGTAGHQVRVHQLFLNQDGWLMAAPYEFNNETVTDDSIATRASIADDEIPGDYQFIRHKYNQSHAAVSSTDEATTATLTEPVNITLTAAGRVTGSVTGTWTRTAGTDYITLTLGGVVYKGVLVRQRIDYTNIRALCIAALSSSSGSLTIGQNSFTYQQEIWASKAPARAAIKYTLDKNAVSFTDGATVTDNLTLPKTGYLGAKVSWSSSDGNVLNAQTGRLLGDGSVTLTMTVTKDGQTYTRTYNLTVSRGGQSSTPVYFPESSQKNTTAAWWTNFSTQDYSLTKGESAEFRFYNYSNREANYKNWCLYGASGTHGSTGYQEYFGLRCDNWNNTTGSNTGCTSNFDWSTFTTDMDGSLVDLTATYGSDGNFTMNANIKTTSGKSYTYSYNGAVSGAPAAITLFFVSEGSYIDGSSLATGISTVNADAKPKTNGRAYNLNGQPVSDSYRGIIIRDGKKLIRR